MRPGGEAGRLLGRSRSSYIDFALGHNAPLSIAAALHEGHAHIRLTEVLLWPLRPSPLTIAPAPRSLDLCPDAPIPEYIEVEAGTNQTWLSRPHSSMSSNTDHLLKTASGPASNFKIARRSRLQALCNRQHHVTSPADCAAQARDDRSKSLSKLGNSDVAGGRATVHARGSNSRCRRRRASRNRQKSKPSASACPDKLFCKQLYFCAEIQGSPQGAARPQRHRGRQSARAKTRHRAQSSHYTGAP